MDKKPLCHFKLQADIHGHIKSMKMTEPFRNSLLPHRIPISSNVHWMSVRRRGGGGRAITNHTNCLWNRHESLWMTCRLNKHFLNEECGGGVIPKEIFQSSDVKLYVHSEAYFHHKLSLKEC